MTKKKIGLVGYFGWGNFGDELFLRVHQQELGDRYDLEIVHDILSQPYFSKSIKAVVDKYDGFIIGGGDLINPVRVSPLYWQLEYLRRPVFIFGLGVPIQPWNRANVNAHYRAFFQHPNCKLVVARDVESANWIAANLQPSCPLEWFPDPVCAMQFPVAMGAEKKTLGVVMRSHRSLSDDLSAVRRLIDTAKDYEFSIRHLVLGIKGIGEADALLAEKLAKPGEEVVRSDDLSELCAQISSCSMLATIKFHGLVAATMYGIPAIAMSVTPKNRNFLKMIAREEMIGGYNQDDTWKKLSRFPARIHPLVRDYLQREAKLGYARLRQAMEEHLSG